MGSREWKQSRVFSPSLSSKMKEKHQKWTESIRLPVGVCISYLFMLASMYNWADKMKEFRTYLTWPHTSRKQDKQYMIACLKNFP